MKIIECIHTFIQKPMEETHDMYPKYELCDKAKYDIVFVVDISRSMTKESFKLLKQGISDFVRKLEIGPYDTQV